MALSHLRGAVRTDIAEAGQIVMLLGVRIVPAAEGSMSDPLAVVPALSRGNVPDVLVGTTQAKGGLGAKLFGHGPSLRLARTMPTHCRAEG